MFDNDKRIRWMIKESITDDLNDLDIDELDLIVDLIDTMKKSKK